MGREINILTPEQAMREAGYSADAIRAVRKVDAVQAVEPAGNFLRVPDVIYVGIMPDDSASIRQHGNTQDVIDGHNLVINDLSHSQEEDSMLIRTQYLNGHVLNNWVTLENAQPMDSQNFHPDGGTPLYDSTIVMLASLVLERQRALGRGQEARFSLLVVSDGLDEGSVSQASDVKVIVDSMKQKGDLLETTEPGNRRKGSITFLGINDGVTDYNEIAESMGIGWVLDADRKYRAEMRRTFSIFSRAQLR